MGVVKERTQGTGQGICFLLREEVGLGVGALAGLVETSVSYGLFLCHWLPSHPRPVQQVLESSCCLAVLARTHVSHA